MFIYVYQNLAVFYKDKQCTRYQSNYTSNTVETNNIISPYSVYKKPVKQYDYPLSQQILKSIKDKDAPYCVGSKQEYKATVGLNTTLFEFDTMKFLVWDLGGKPSIRKIWQSYFPYTHGFIYMFDERVQDGLTCLRNILSNGDMYQIPCLILIRNSQIKARIEDVIRQDQQKYGDVVRCIKIELIPLSRQQLYRQLLWIYQEIRRLDLRIKK